MQKKKSLCVEFCRSRAAKEGCRISWILIEFTNSTINLKHDLGFHIGLETKGKQGGLGCSRPKFHGHSEIHQVPLLDPGVACRRC